MNIEEKTLYGNNIVYLKFLTENEYINLNQPLTSSVHCFPIKNNQVLFTLNPRGIDIIGGHVEKNETPEQALLREAKEEASIDLINYKLIGAIQVDNRDNNSAIKKGYPLIGYQLFYISSDYITNEFKADFECTGRQYVNIEDISKVHHKWLPTHDQLLNEIKKIIDIDTKMKIS